MYNLRKEITSLVTATSDKNGRITDLEQMFKQKMAQVSTIQDHLAEVSDLPKEIVIVGIYNTDLELSEIA